VNGRQVSLVLARDLMDTVTARISMTNIRELGSASGAALEHMRLQHPFYDRDVPVILGDHVTTEAGTGAVHTAPGHGEEDFIVGREYDLPVNSPVGGDGRYLDNVEMFAGEWVWAANDHILDVMRGNGTLLFVELFERSRRACADRRWMRSKP
jgi:isoleucyl-tRNA synthetase